MKNYITMDQLSGKLAGRSIRSIQRDVKSSQLPKPYQVGGRLLWDTDEVDAHIANQSNKPQLQEIPMTKLETARTELKNITDRHKATQTELNEMKATLHNAHSINNAEIDARTSAAVAGHERSDQEMIDVPALTSQIEMKQKVLAAMTSKVRDAGLALRDAAEHQGELTKKRYRDILVSKYGMTGNNRIPFAGLIDGSIDDLLDINALLTKAFGRAFTMTEMMQRIIEPAKLEVYADAEHRAARIMAQCA